MIVVTTAIFFPTTVLTDDAIAQLAVSALRAEADLTPKPGLVDQRGSGAHSDMNLAMLHASAEALRSSFTECAAAARQLATGPDLRAAIGVIGRAGEQDMLEATDGVNTHRGALWALGLLSAGAATEGGVTAAIDVASRLASIPDPAADGQTLSAVSHGARARRRYGVPALSAKLRRASRTCDCTRCLRYAPPADPAPTKVQRGWRRCSH